MSADWAKTTVKELIDSDVLFPPMDGNHGGSHPKGDDFVGSGIPFIMASDVDQGRLSFESCKFITKQQADSLRKGFAVKGDVLLTHKATIGRTAIVPDIETEYVMLTPQVTYYRIKDHQKLNNKFLKYYFDSSHFQQTFNAWSGGGSTRAYLGITAQQKLPVNFPPLPEQQAIAEILSSLDDKIELNNKMNKTLEEMAQAIFKHWFIDFEFPMELATQNQPSPPAPLPEVEGSGNDQRGRSGDDGGATHYRGGLDFSGFVERARELRGNQTPAEAILWELLRNRQLADLKFRRQHQIGNYIADFYCHDCKLVIELDGSVHANSRQQKHDHKRDEFLKSSGYNVIRFKNEDVLHDTENLLKEILKHTPQNESPSTRGEGCFLAPGYKSNGGEMVDSDLGMIPKGWRVDSIGRILDLAYGKSLTKSSRKPGRVPVYGSGGVGGFHNSALVNGPGVIIGRKGTVGTVYWEQEDFYPIDTVFFVKVKFGGLPLSWCYYNLILMDIARLGADSAVPGVNRNSIYAQKWVVPTESHLLDFDKHFQDIWSQKIANETETGNLSLIRDALLPKLMSGELRVPDVVKAMSDGQDAESLLRQGFEGQEMVEEVD